MEPNTEAIIAMAWARELGTADDAFSGPGPRLEVPDEAAQILAIRLRGRTALRGPRWSLDSAASYADEALLSSAGLLQLTRERQPSGIYTARLLYADDYLASGELSQAVTTSDPAALDEVLSRSAPDDVDSDRVRASSHTFVLLHEDHPVAAAAYDDHGGLLADLTIVEPIDARGSGAGAIVGAIATNDALDEGLIPQLRIEHDHAFAEALGFIELGQLAKVRVGA